MRRLTVLLICFAMLVFYGYSGVHSQSCIEGCAEYNCVEDEVNGGCRRGAMHLCYSEMYSDISDPDEVCVLDQPLTPFNAFDCTCSPICGYIGTEYALSCSQGEFLQIAFKSQCAAQQGGGSD